MTDVPDDVRRDAGTSPLVPGAAADLAVPVDHPRPGVLVLRPVGEIDLRTAPQFRRAVLDRMSGESRCVVVDLDGIDFMGSHGAAVLLDAHTHAAEIGVRFMIAGGQRPVLRVLELTGLDTVLDLRRSVSQAIPGGG